jgi:hypothetical protein
LILVYGLSFVWFDNLCFVNGYSFRFQHLFCSFDNANDANGEKWRKPNKYLHLQPNQLPLVMRYGSMCCATSCNTVPQWRASNRAILRFGTESELAGGENKDRSDPLH